MSRNNKWKDKLLSSSLPLEFEVAKKLSKHGFSITADYTYSRDDAGIVKDFSVDIHAGAILPFSNPNKIKSYLELLIECKQRHPKVKWLFFQDPNREEFSSIASGTTIRKFDYFAPTFINSAILFDFDEKAKYCYKGIEVDESNGNVYDAELKHGLSQLQYALPRLIADTVEDGIRSFPDDSFPSFICPILLTTAELLVTRRDLTIEAVQRSRSLHDFSKKVPYLIFYSDFGPGFERHCVSEFAHLMQVDSDLISSVERFRYERGEYSFYLPKYIFESLATCKRYVVGNLFTKFVVCQMSYIDILLYDIKKYVSTASRVLSSHKQR